MLQLHCCRRILGRIRHIVFQNNFLDVGHRTFKSIEHLWEIGYFASINANCTRLSFVVHKMSKKKAKNDVNNHAVQPQNDVIIKK